MLPGYGGPQDSYIIYICSKVRSNNNRFPVTAQVEKLVEGWHYYKNWKKINSTFHNIAFTLQFTNPPESCNVLIYLFSNNYKMAE